MSLDMVGHVSQHRFYNRWKTLNKMFTNPNNKHYPQYGGAGVGFDFEWSNNNPDGSRNFVNWLDKQYEDNPELDPENSAVIRQGFEGNFGPDSCIVANRKDISRLAAMKSK